MDGKFLEVKRRKFEHDPRSNSGQPSVWSITHGVFFFGIGEYAFNRLRTQCIGLFAQRRMAYIFRLFNVILPDMAGNGFYALLILGTLFSHRAVPADITLAFVFPVAFTVCCRIAQYMILRT